MKKILICVFWLLFMVGVNLIYDIEYNLNTISADSGFVLLKSTEFDEQLTTYIEEHNIIVYTMEGSAKPFYLYNVEPNSKTTEINDSSDDVYTRLMGEKNAGTYYLSFINSDVSPVEFEQFLISTYSLDYNSDIIFFENGAPVKVNLNLGIATILILIIILLIVIVDFISKNSNLIYLSKVNGKSNVATLKILASDLLPAIIIASILSISTYVIFMPYYSYFSLILMLLLIALIIGVIVLVIFVAFLIQSFKKINVKIRIPQFLLYVFNIIFIIMFLTIGVASLLNLANSAKILINLQINEEYYTQYYYGQGTRTPAAADMDEFESSGSYGETLYELGAFTFNYNPYNNVIYTDENYINSTDYSELAKYDYLVPEAEEEVFLAAENPNDNANIYYYTQDVVLISPDYRYITIKNPIISVDHSDKLTSNGFYVPATMPIEEYKEIIDNLFFESTTSQGVVLVDYERVKQQERYFFTTKVNEFILKFVLYLVIIIVNIVLIIRRFFESNKEEIIIKRVNGKSFNQKLKQNLTISNLIIIILCNIIQAPIISYLLLIVINIIIIIIYKNIEKTFRRIHD